MPFTPAHAALVLPVLKKRFLSATALIMGSVSPDFEYFLRADVYGNHGHTLAGIFYFDVPVTIVLGLLFHHVVKQSFMANLPEALQHRLVPLSQVNFKQNVLKQPIIVVVSAVIGAASHIFWDAFTHHDGYFASRISFYDKVTIPFMGVNYPFFYAAQNASTFAGLAVIAFYVFRMPRIHTRTPKPSLIYWIFLLVLAVLFFSIRFWLWPKPILLGVGVVTAISALCLAVVVLGLVSKFQDRAQPHS
jgi:hypothetical protein